MNTDRSKKTAKSGASILITSIPYPLQISEYFHPLLVKVLSRSVALVFVAIALLAGAALAAPIPQDQVDSPLPTPTKPRPKPTATNISIVQPRPKLKPTPTLEPPIVHVGQSGHIGRTLPRGQFSIQANFPIGSCVNPDPDMTNFESFDWDCVYTDTTYCAIYYDGVYSIHSANFIGIQTGYNYLFDYDASANGWLALVDEATSEIVGECFLHSGDTCEFPVLTGSVHYVQAGFAEGETVPGLMDWACIVQGDPIAAPTATPVCIAPTAWIVATPPSQACGDPSEILAPAACALEDTRNGIDSISTSISTTTLPISVTMSSNPVAVAKGLIYSLASITWLQILFGWFLVAFMSILVIMAVRFVASMWGIVDRIIALIKTIPFIG